MKIIKRFLIVVVSLVALLVVFAFFLPSNIHVERSTIIKAPAELVFNQVNTLKNWDKWSPWMEKDPKMQVTYSGPESGIGNMQQWKSDNKEVGTGSMTITDSKPNDSIALALIFQGHGNAQGSFKFQGTPEGTRVTWGMDMAAGMNPMMRWMGLFMDQMMGDTFEHGLAKLKSVAEGMGTPEQPSIGPAPEDSIEMNDSSKKMPA